MHKGIRFRALERFVAATAVAATTMSVACAGGDTSKLGTTHGGLSNGTLRVSASPDLSSSTPLDQSTLAGAEYVFLDGTQGVTDVAFYLDDPGMTGAPISHLYDPPWDLEGASNGAANPLDTATLSTGGHSITAFVSYANDDPATVTAAFTVGVAPSPTADAGPPPANDGGAPPATDGAPPADGGTVTQGRVYPLHTNIVSTTFWVGELFNASRSDGSQVCSAYDKNWAFHWSGISTGTVPATAAGCAGSITGGCDGIASSGGGCATEVRTAANNFFPTQGTPLENPFYLDLPFDDLNDATAFAERCSVIPWANDPGYAGHCSDTSFSYMKNRWVKITGPTGQICYGQNEDAGPSHDSLYHDAAYVFGSNDARPVQGQFNNAGLDVSPALNGCLGYAELDGQNDHVTWQFVDDVDVPAGPWKVLVTTSGVQ